jgi:ABC-2 type transport system ATP-binding protein
VVWVRNLAKYYAAQGRTVFLSSHLMSEVALTADHIIVIGRGRVLADAPVADIVHANTATSVRVRSPQAAALAEFLAGDHVTVTSSEPGLLSVVGVDAPRIGELAAARGVVLHELTPVTSTLEDAYLALTADEVEYQTQAADTHLGHGIGVPGAAMPGTPAAPFAPTAPEGAQR